MQNSQTLQWSRTASAVGCEWGKVVTTKGTYVLNAPNVIFFYHINPENGRDLVRTTPINEAERKKLAGLDKWKRFEYYIRKHGIGVK